MKKLIKQLKSDISELKRLKKELKKFNIDNEAITIINSRIKLIKFCINELKYSDLSPLTEEQQDFITEMPIINLGIIERLEIIIEQILEEEV